MVGKRERRERFWACESRAILEGGHCVRRLGGVVVVVVGIVAVVEVVVVVAVVVVVVVVLVAIVP